MHLTYAKMLAIVVHENMKLGDNTLNNEKLTLVNTKFPPKYQRIVALIVALIMQENAFEHKKKKPWLSANWPSNNWAQVSAIWTSTNWANFSLL